MKVIYTSALLAAILLQPSLAFTPIKFLPVQPWSSQNHFDLRRQRQKQEQNHHQRKSDYQLKSLSNSIEIAGECLLTPEGYGFSSSIERILNNTNKHRVDEESKGYYKGSANESIIEIMSAITSNNDADVALVYSNDDPSNLLVIFTETDYINVLKELCSYRLHV